jgi:hypothetical protein
MKQTTTYRYPYKHQSITQQPKQQHKSTIGHTTEKHQNKEIKEIKEKKGCRRLL